MEPHRGGDGSGSEADHPGQYRRALPPWPPTSVRSQSGAEFLRSPWFGPACDPVPRGTGMPSWWHCVVRPKPIGRAPEG